MQKSFEKLYEISFREFKVNFLYSQSYNVVEIIIEIFTFVYGGYMVINKRISLGEFTMITAFFDYILSGVNYFFNFGSSLQGAIAMEKRVLEILDIDVDTNGKIYIPNIENIKISNLNFSYGDKKIIENFNYEFFKNNIYLIKGKNGVGKSTLINLILGLYIDEYFGSIKYNDIDIKMLDMIEIRKNIISVVEQKPVLIDMDAILNIGDEELKNFNIEYISKEKLALYKEEEYSGGENQKLSILNSIEKNTSLLILDEPSSNLDEISRDNLLEILKNLKDKIIIIISHDTQFEKIADKIMEI